MAKRVLLAGLFHETHTFLEGLTSLADFSVRRGDELWTAKGDGSPLGGVLDFASAAGWDAVPTPDIRATPSATVADNVLEEFWQAFEAAAEFEIPRGVDGIYLILHGAMATKSLPDAEGEILSRIREIPGARELPLAGVLDLHCNYSNRMAVHSDALVAYRENPHTDAEAAARQGAQVLDRMMEQGTRPVTVWSQPAVVWPPTGVGTADDPMRTLEQMARDIEARQPEIAAVNVFAGYSFADTPDTGVAFSAVTFGDPAMAAAELQKLTDWAVANRALGNKVDRPIEDAMPEVLAHTQGPVALVEPSDNIGGGAPGDGTGILKTLLAHDVQNAAVVINDPAAAAAAHRAGIGATLTLQIGGTGSRITSGPAELEVAVFSLSDGKFDLEDRHSHLASMCGVHIDMGPSAVVRHRGIRILLTTHKTPPFDLGQLRSQGIVPEELAVIGVKAAVAHRQAYNPITHASYTVDTPGPCSSNLQSLPFRLLRRPIYPLDEDA